MGCKESKLGELENELEKGYDHILKLEKERIEILRQRSLKSLLTMPYMKGIKEIWDEYSNLPLTERSEAKVEVYEQLHGDARSIFDTIEKKGDFLDGVHSWLQENMDKLKKRHSENKNEKQRLN